MKEVVLNVYIWFNSCCFWGRVVSIFEQKVIVGILVNCLKFISTNQVEYLYTNTDFLIIKDAIEEVLYLSLHLW